MTGHRAGRPGSRSPEANPDSTTIRRAVSVNTVTKRRPTAQLAQHLGLPIRGIGQHRVQVTTNGCSSSLTSDSTYEPASPPKIPYSCSISTTSVPRPSSGAGTAT